MTVQRAFTLVELLVSISIIGILLAIALPAVQHVRESSRRQHCANNIRQIALAALNYESANQRLPVGCHGPDGKEYVTWLAELLPYIEQSAMYAESQRAFKLGISPFLQRLHQTPVPLFGCPTDGRSGLPQWTHGPKLVALTSYVGVSGIDRVTQDGVLIYGKAIRLSEIVDGISHTLMAGERPASSDNWYGWWYAGVGQWGDGNCESIMGVCESNLLGQYTADCPVGPYRYSDGQFDEMCDMFHFWSPHPGGANFAFCDGSTRFIRYEAAEQVAFMATRDGREPAADR
jgi:prepilin-type N-terminal cleavage/methylation domain-containing protein/prepilin-type processing-associated H-X9-DG protein